MKLKYLPLLSSPYIPGFSCMGATYTYYRSITVTSTTSIASDELKLPMLFREPTHA